MVSRSNKLSFIPCLICPISCLRLINHSVSSSICVAYIFVDPKPSVCLIDFDFTVPSFSFALNTGKIMICTYLSPSCNVISLLLIFSRKYLISPEYPESMIPCHICKSLNTDDRKNNTPQWNFGMLSFTPDSISFLSLGLRVTSVPMMKSYPASSSLNVTKLPL